MASCFLPASNLNRLNIMTTRTLYLLTTTDLWMTVANKLSKTYGWDPVLLVGDLSSSQLSTLDESIFSECPIYKLADARLAIRPSNIQSFKPRYLDSETLSSFEKHQSVIFDMMSRFLINSNNGTVEDRKEWYWELLRIWLGIFDTLNPDLIIAASFPHRVFDYLIVDM